MNRRERRKAQRTRATQIDVRSIDLDHDIQVDAKIERIVMIFANAKGRGVVEDLWPDVEWETDKVFSSAHSPDWMFTHIRVTRLPPCFEERVPLTFASPDALGFAGASALQHRAEPKR